MTSEGRMPGHPLVEFVNELADLVKISTDRVGDSELRAQALGTVRSGLHLVMRGLEQLDVLLEAAELPPPGSDSPAGEAANSADSYDIRIE